MESTLSNFSDQLAGLIGQAGQSAVAVEARHRIGSSGILWKPGIIVTAEHTIRREEDIPVVLPDGKRAAAELIGRDPRTDIAVLRVEGALGPEFPASSAPRTGEIVVTVGRHDPGLLASIGIVSTAGGPWKNWRGGHFDSLLRLDVGAYPRSSGSVVIDTRGHFVGMLTTALTRTAPVAIPASTVERIAGELIQHGRIARGYLGVGLQPIPLPAAFSKTLGRQQQTGVIVLSVEPGAPADRGGMVLGDVIAEIGGEAIADTDDLQSAIRGAIGKELPVVILRGGERVERTVTVGERRS